MELTQEQYNELINKIRILTFQQQENQDTLQGGLTSRNLVSFRNTYVINAQDSLDASYPMYVHFNIISEMIKIVSVKVSFWLLNYRAYSTAASSGGAVSSASGGGETPTSSSDGAVSSASGGGETPTSSSVSTPSGGGSTSGATGSASGGGSTSGSGGATTPTSAAGGVVTSAAGGEVSSASGGGETPTSGSESGNTQYAIGDVPWQSVTNVGTENLSGKLATSSTNIQVPSLNHTHTVTVAAHTHTGGSHTHTGGSHTHTVTIGNHTHTTPAHTHPNHTHTTPAHTHPAHTHTVTVAAHTHTGGAHTHTVTVAAHTHTGGAHTHGITYGIFEDSTSPTIKFYISENEGVSYNDTFFGGYDDDKKDLEITSLLAGAGSKLIKFESDLRARLSVQIELKIDIKSR